MIKKKRVTKYISILSVSLGIIIATLFSNTQEIKAYTNYATDGSWSISTYLQLSAPSQTGQSDIAHLYGTINFNDPSTGSITLNLYNLVSISYSALIENAAISVKNNTKIILNFKECTYIEFDLVIDAQDLLAKLVSGGYASTLNTALTYLRNHEATVFNVKSSTRSTSIDITTDDILIEMNTTMGTISTDIDELIGYVDNIETYLTDTNSHLSNIETYVDDLLTTVNNIQTYNIPLYMYPAVLLFDRSYDLQYNNSWSLPTFNCSANSSYTTSMYFKVYPNTTKYFVFYMKDTKRSTYGYVNNNDADFTWTKHVVSVTSTYNLYYDEIYTETNSNYTPTNTVDYDIMPVFIGTLDQMPDEVRILIGLDSATVSAIEESTTSINSSINSSKTTLNNSIVSAKNAIVNALQNLNITVENNTEISNVVNNKDTTINNITNEHNTVNNITNDFTVDFTTADNAITFNSDIISSLTDTATFWNGKISEVEVSLGNLHYPIVLGFILLALLAFIGG